MHAPSRSRRRSAIGSGGGSSVKAGSAKDMAPARAARSSRAALAASPCVVGKTALPLACRGFGAV